MPDADLVEYRPSRGRMGVVALFLLLLVAGEGWLIAESRNKADDMAFGIAGLIVFGAAFVATLFPLFRPRALLRIDEEALTEWGHFGGESLRLRWADVARIEWFRWRRVPMLAVTPTDEARVLDGAPPSVARAARGNRRTYGHPFVIDPRMYGRSVDEVAAEIGRRLATLPPEPVAYPRPEGTSRGNVTVG